MARARRALERLGDRADRDLRVEPGRIDLLDGRREDDVDARFLADREVARLVARVLLEVGGLAELLGLTKIDITTVALSARARSTSDTCPSCSQPIVGTRPTGRGAVARAARSSARVRTTCIGWGGGAGSGVSARRPA